MVCIPLCLYISAYSIHVVNWIKDIADGVRDGRVLIDHYHKLYSKW